MGLQLYSDVGLLVPLAQAFTPPRNRDFSPASPYIQTILNIVAAPLNLAGLKPRIRTTQNPRNWTSRLFGRGTLVPLAQVLKLY
jgi:hypothetical protein